MQAILCPPDFLWTLATTEEDLPTGRPNFSCHPPISSLCSNVEPEDELEASRMLFPAAIFTFLLNESCDGDTEDETLPELADNPGTTISTKLSV